MTEREAVAVVVTAIFISRLVELELLRGRNAPGGRRVRWSTSVNVAVGAVFTIGVVLETLLRQGPILWWVSGAGLGLYAGRSAIKAWSVRTLGEAWSSHVEIRPGHRLVQGGAYSWVRHPIYFALFLEPVALAMVGNAPITGICGAAVLWPLFGIRLWAEERALIDRFGDAYREYACRVPCLVPRPFRRTSLSPPGR